MCEEVGLKQKTVTITVVFISAVILLALRACCHSGDIINGGICIGTAALAAVAYIQLDALNKQTNSSFLLTFNREFFDKQQNQDIIVAIEEKKPLLVKNGGKFTYFQLDDYLGYFELMALFEKKNTIDFESIDEMFGYYITSAWKNEEVKGYVMDLRKESLDNTFYGHFQSLARRVEEGNKERQAEYKEG